jgi:hypothetical protein
VTDTDPALVYPFVYVTLPRVGTVLSLVKVSVVVLLLPAWSVADTASEGELVVEAAHVKVLDT